MVPGANSPRSKGQDSPANLICDDEEDIVKVCSHSITKTLTALVKYQIDN